MGNKISHRLPPNSDREPLALLQGPQQPRELSLGLESADADVHDFVDLVHGLIYLWRRPLAVLKYLESRARVFLQGAEMASSPLDTLIAAQP